MFPPSDPIHRVSLPLLRYPRTMHLEGSRLHGDDDSQTVKLADLAGQHAVIEEKLDGANCAISFSESGELLLQSRGHYLVGGGRERQFAPLHPWARSHECGLLERLEDRFVLYGEWTYAKHSVFYDRLPHFFHEFDVWDRSEQRFLSTPRRRALLAGLPVLSVPVLYEGPMPSRLKALTSWVRPSFAKSARWVDSFHAEVKRRGLDAELTWRQTDSSNCAEGLYIKLETADEVTARYKWVRADFTQTILDSGSHHAERPLFPNQLAEGVDVYSPQLALRWEDLGLVTVRGDSATAPPTATQRRTGRAS